MRYAPSPFATVDPVARPEREAAARRPPGRRPRTPDTTSTATPLAWPVFTGALLGLVAASPRTPPPSAARRSSSAAPRAAPAARRSALATTMRPFTNDAALERAVAVRHLGDDLGRPARLVDRRVDEHHLAGERAARQRVGRELERLAHLDGREARRRHRHRQVEQPVVDDAEQRTRRRPCSRRGRRR